jgi:glycosyltransferase involved in cell wall biosynthesis
MTTKAEDPLVSVIIGFRDWGLDTLEFVIRTHKLSSLGDRLEVIVSDYGSEDIDGVRERCEAAGAKVVRTQRGGHNRWNRSAALNAGIRQGAKGKYILTTDADILFHPKTIETVVNSMEEVGSDEKVYGLVQCRDLPESMPKEDLSEWPWDIMEVECSMRPPWGMGGCALFPRTFLDHVQGYDERLEWWGGEDNDLALRAEKSGLQIHWVEHPEARIYHLWHTKALEKWKEDSRFQEVWANNRELVKTTITTYRNLEKWGGMPSPPPTMSVIVITRNRSDLLRDCIKSILNQTFERFEFLIIDDGSTDDTEEVVSEFKDPRIRYFKRPAQGIPFARNFGAKNARGEYITIMDDDDLMLPNRLRDQLTCLSKGSDGSYGGWIDHNLSDNILEHFPGKKRNYSSILFGGRVMIHPASMIRRSILLEHPYNEDFAYGSDYDMNLRIAEAGVQLDHTGSYLIVRRMHDGNVTVTNTDEQKTTGRSSAILHRDRLSEDEQNRMRVEGRAALEMPVSSTPGMPQIAVYFPWLGIGEDEEVEDIHDIDDETPLTTYDVSKNWRQNGRRLIFDAGGVEIFFRMPVGWSIEATHPDLFQLSHYVMMSPWDKTILDDWAPSRHPGWRPGLAFSGGIDSTAAMTLMPQTTVLVYNEREGIDTKLDHTNAFRLFGHMEETLGRPVIRIASDHEKIRMRDGKGPGFSTDYACAVGVILLADHLGLDSIATGMPLENSYLWHGYRYRDFSETWFWRHYGELFESVGLPIYQPVAGCSELINMRIVQHHHLDNWAQSCLRSSKEGEVCQSCWKCFRKNTLLGRPFKMSPEITKFLKEEPLKQAVSTLFSIQSGGVASNGTNIESTFPHLKSLLEMNLNWLERHYPPALELLPKRYREYTTNRLEQISAKMTQGDVESLHAVDLYPDIEQD